MKALVFAKLLLVSSVHATTLGCDEYRQSAIGGDAYSQLLLGGCLAVSRETDAEIAEAKRWYRSVIAGDGSQRHKDDAAAALAGLLLFFSASPTDHKEAIDLLQNTVSTPHKVAYANFGLALLIGRGIEPSPTEGVELLNRAAEAKNQLAAISLFIAAVNGRFGLGEDASDRYWELWLKTREFFTTAEKCAMADGLSDDEIFGSVLYSSNELEVASAELSLRLGCDEASQKSE